MSSNLFAITGSGYVGALRAELLKTRKRWAPWIVLIIELAIVLLLGYFLYWLLADHPSTFNLPPAGAKALLAGVYPGGFVSKALSSQLTPIMAVLLGVLVIGNDFGSGTLKTLFTLRPARLEALTAKFTALAIAVAVGVVVLFAVSAAASVLLAAIDGASVTSWPPIAEIARGLLAGWLIWGWWALFGAVLGILFQNMALAIGIGLAYQLVIEDLLLSLGTAFKIQFFVDLKRALPGPNARWISDAFPVHQAGHAAVTTVASGANNAGQASLILAGWCVLGLLISAAVVARRDVT